MKIHVVMKDGRTFDGPLFDIQYDAYKCEGWFALDVDHTRHPEIPEVFLFEQCASVVDLARPDIDLLLTWEGMVAYPTAQVRMDGVEPTGLPHTRPPLISPSSFPAPSTTENSPPSDPRLHAPSLPQTLTLEVLRGFRAMACTLTALQAEHPAVRAACEWLELAPNDVDTPWSIELESAGRSTAVAKDVYEERKRVFCTNLPRDLYEACSRAFGTTRNDAKERLLAAMYGMDKARKLSEALSKELSQTVLYSPRGIPLVWGGGHPKDGAVLTVECYCKWYELFLVCPDTIVGIDFGMLDHHSNNESPYCDHAPNPKAVYRYAQARGYQLDNEAFEMIIGRWEIEYHENYDVEQEDNHAV